MARRSGAPARTDRRSGSSALEAIKHGKGAIAGAPAVPDNRRQLCTGYVFLARVYRDQAWPAEAANATLEREKLYPNDPDELYGVGVCLSMCVPLVAKEKKLDGPRASQTRPLRRSGHGGTSQSDPARFKNVEDMKKRPDLNPIRSRKDFQDLLLDAAFPLRRSQERNV